METNLAIASTFRIGKEQKASKIHKTALFCSFLSFLREYNSGVLL